MPLPAPLHPNFEVILGTVRKKGGDVDVVRNALQKLCRKGSKKNRGFDSKELSIRIGQIIACVCGGREVDPLSFGEGPTDRLKPSDLDHMVDHAKKLRDYVSKLNRTPFAAYLSLSHRVQSGGIIGYLTAGEQQLAILDPILKIPALAAQHRRKTQPLIDHFLLQLCRYLEKTLGGPNYQALVDIFSPFHIAHAQSVDHLKNWRASLRRKT